MKFFSTENDLLVFLNEVAIQKSSFQKLSYLHITQEAVNGTMTPLPIPELTQFLSFFFPKKDLMALFLNKTSEMLLVANKDDVLGLNLFEKALQENFTAIFFKTQVRGFDPGGLDVFAKTIEKSFSPEDFIGRTLLTRMRRSRNCIMVLDDDKMVTRQMEKILGAVGLVIAINDTDDFLNQYAEYAPDILFLDIHLGVEKGTRLLRDLTSKIDPYAHIVMISSDTKQDTVLDIKEGGAKGFIVKPFKREAVLQHLFRAPTFVPWHLK